MCWNTGSITATSKTATNYSYAGGISGCLTFNGTEFSVYDCFNQGNITTLTDCCAGIVGCIGNLSKSMSGGKLNTRCYNSGKLFGSGSFIGNIFRYCIFWIYN